MDDILEGLLSELQSHCTARLKECRELYANGQTEEACKMIDSLMDAARNLDRELRLEIVEFYGEICRNEKRVKWIDKSISDVTNKNKTPSEGGGIFH